MAKFDSTTYLVVKISDLVNERYIGCKCIPVCWAENSPGNNNCLIIRYPEEESIETILQIKNKGPPKTTWPFYSALIMFRTESYDEAIKFIAENEKKLLTTTDEQLTNKINKTESYEKTLKLIAEINKQNFTATVFEQRDNKMKKTETSATPSTSSLKRKNSNDKNTIIEDYQPKKKRESAIRSENNLKMLIQSGQVDTNKQKVSPKKTHLSLRKEVRTETLATLIKAQKFDKIAKLYSKTFAAGSHGSKEYVETSDSETETLPSPDKKKLEPVTPNVPKPANATYVSNLSNVTNPTINTNVPNTTNVPKPTNTTNVPKPTNVSNLSNVVNPMNTTIVPNPTNNTIVLNPTINTNVPNTTNVPKPTNTTNVPKPTNVSNLSNVANPMNTTIVPNPTNNTNVSNPTNTTNVRKPANTINVPKPANTVNVPNPTNNTNVPKPTNITNVPDSTNTTSEPDSANVPQQSNTTNVPDSINEPNPTNTTNVPDSINEPNPTNTTNVPDSINEPNPTNTTNLPNSTNTINFPKLTNTTNVLKPTNNTDGLIPKNNKIKAIPTSTTNIPKPTNAPKKDTSLQSNNYSTRSKTPLREAVDTSISQLSSTNNLDQNKELETDFNASRSSIDAEVLALNKLIRNLASDNSEKGSENLRPVDIKHVEDVYNSVLAVKNKLNSFYQEKSLKLRKSFENIQLIVPELKRGLTLPTFQELKERNQSIPSSPPQEQVSQSKEPSSNTEISSHQRSSSSESEDSLSQSASSLPKCSYVAKWTLRHKGPGPGLTEVIENTGIYIDEPEFIRSKLLATDMRHLARLLLPLIFSEEAMNKCSYTGNGPNGKRPKSADADPGLDEHARNVLMAFVNQYAKKSGWTIVSPYIMNQSMRDKLRKYQLRNHTWKRIHDP